MSAGEFLSVTETKVPIVHPPGGGRAVGVLGDRTTFKVTSEETGGAYAILEQVIPAHHGPPLHIHKHETEIFYVLEGEFEIRVGGETIPAGVGAFAACPRDIPHTFRNVGDTPGRLLLTVIPGGFSNYFAEVDGIPDRSVETIRELLEKYEVEILE